MNKNLTQLGQQLLGIWKQLGPEPAHQHRPGHRPWSAAAWATWPSGPAARISPCFTANWTKGKPSKVIAALDESKVPYQIRGGGSIYVPSDKVYQVRMQMAGKGIPRGEGVGLRDFRQGQFRHLRFRAAGQLHPRHAGRTGPHHQPAGPGRDRARHDRHAGEPAAHRQPAQAHRLGLRPREGRRASCRPPRSIPSASWWPTAWKACKPTMFPWWTTWATCSRKTRKRFRGRAVQQPACRPPQLRAIPGQKGRRHARTGPGPGPGRRPRLGRVELGHHDPHAKKNTTRTARWRSTTTINDENTDSATIAPAAARREWRPTSVDNATPTAGPCRSTRATRKKGHHQPVRNQQDHQQDGPGAGRHQAPLPPPSSSRSVLRARAPTAKPYPRTPEEMEKLTPHRAKRPGHPDRTATRPARMKSRWRRCRSTTSRRCEMTQQLDQQEKRQFWLDLAQKLDLSRRWPPGSLFLFWRMWQNTAKDEIPIVLPDEPTATATAKQRLAGTGRRHGRSAQPVDPGESGQHDPGRAQLAGARQT